ncbi:MAG: metallophosphoesterase, partial [Thermoanaerobaculia bacterium]
MRTLLAVLLTLVPLSAVAKHDPVVLLHFSDYHSHAVPFFTERGPSQGGIARAIGYLAREKKQGALVFSGGDMMNKGAPSWSDKYGCAEWPWLNGIVDAMALGNHDVDYGMDAFAKCRAAIRYPVLSANTEGFEGTRVFAAKGKRIGVFAVAGPDLPRLMKPSGLNFSDPVEAARRAVAALRARQVDAIVMLGHQQTEDDYALARAVPGIDLIFGTHAHLTRELTQIPGTSTWFISPGQYLETISRVEITFSKDGLGVAGRLVPVDASARPSRRVVRHVASM